MTSRESLLRAVILSPDDDAPRLVFADWLDEHGQPLWADFIRLECRFPQAGPLVGAEAAEELSHGSCCRRKLLGQA